MYPAEYYTDQEPGFRIAELVREQVILHTEEEIPHAVYVEESRTWECADDGTELWARGSICVERESQRASSSGGRAEKSATCVGEGRAARAIFYRTKSRSIFG